MTTNAAVRGDDLAGDPGAEVAAHTPGPWDCDMGDGDYWAVADKNGSTIACLVEPTPRAEARRFELLPRDYEFERALSDAAHFDDDVPAYPHWTVQEANARLIAAAPDLLAALTELVGEELFGDREGAQHSDTDNYRPVITWAARKRARAAIARATGAAP